MFDQSTREAILKLDEQGHSIRGIARALKLSRGAVREVLRSATELQQADPESALRRKQLIQSSLFAIPAR